jgi:DNA uptake protein ComE-like DNA-binding protein
LQIEVPIPQDRLAAPARRALKAAGFTSLEQLAKVREAELEKLHGIGPSALKTLRQALEEQGMSFQTG